MMKGLGLTFSFISMRDMNEMSLSEFMIWLDSAKQHNEEQRQRTEQQ